MKCPPREQFIYTFNPVVEGCYNIVIFLCGTALTFMFTLIGNAKLMPLMVVLASIGIIAWRARRWYFGWLSREWDFAQFDIKDVEQSDLPEEEKKQRIENIKNQKSEVLFSYVWFAAPFIIIGYSIMWLVNGFHGN